MKMSLLITTADKGTIVFSAHELLEIAQVLMQEVYKNETELKRRKFLGPDEGKHYAPIVIGNDPMKWLRTAASLKQGARAQERAEAKENFEELDKITQGQIIAHFRQKIDELENFVANPMTEPVWSFSFTLIDAEVAKLKNKTEQGQQLSDDDYIKALDKINENLLRFAPLHSDFAKKYPEFLKVFSQAYSKECETQDPTSLILKRCNMYCMWNAIVFIKKSHGAGLLPELSKPSNMVGRLFIYMDLINKYKPRQPVSKSVDSPFELYMLLRLMIRSGEDISNCKKQLLDKFISKIKTMPKGFYELCTILESPPQTPAHLQGKKIHVENEKVIFYLIGNRVIGVNQHFDKTGRYAFDYGSDEDTLAKIYFINQKNEDEVLTEIEKYSKTCKDQIKFIDFFLYIYENSLLPYFSDLIDENEYLDIGREEINYKNIAEIKAALVRIGNSETEQSLKVEKTFHVIKSFIGQLFFSISHDISIYCKKPLANTQMVTYPQIYRNLPQKSAADIARYMRDLLTSKISTVDPGHESICILTAVWFLSETSRNPMSLMYSLMMLDIIEENLPYNANCNNPKRYTWDRILWNPITIKSNEQADVRRQSNPQEEGTAGKHPMCHIDSYVRYFTHDLWPLGEPLELVRQKEASILINWLKHAFNRAYPELEITVTSIKEKTKQETFVYHSELFYSYQINRPANIQHPLKNEMKDRIVDMLKNRINNFDNQLCQNTAATLSCTK